MNKLYTELFSSKFGYKTALLVSCLLLCNPTFSAGSLEMQVEKMVKTALKSYNKSMKEKSPQDWLKYFTEDVMLKAPKTNLSGITKLTEYYTDHFQNYNAKYEVQKIIVKGRSAAAELIWSGSDRNNQKDIEVEMVILFELSPSGKFDSVSLYFDTSKLSN